MLHTLLAIIAGLIIAIALIPVWITIIIVIVACIIAGFFLATEIIVKAGCLAIKILWGSIIFLIIVICFLLVTGSIFYLLHYFHFI